MNLYDNDELAAAEEAPLIHESPISVGLLRSPLRDQKSNIGNVSKPAEEAILCSCCIRGLPALPRLIRYREDLHARTERPIFDLCILVIFYFGFGTTFYAVCDEDFTLIYAFFYATNVGLGVGYGNYHIRDIFTKWFTVFYILAGSSLVIGSLSVFFNHLFYRVWRKTGSLDSVFRTACCLYGVMVCLGVLIGFRIEGYSSFVDALLFAVGNYTTAGLIQPHDSFASLLFTTLSLFVGIPANFIVMGQIASRVLRRYYPEGGQGHEESAHLRTSASTDRLSFLDRKSKVDTDKMESTATERAYCTYLEQELLRFGVTTADKLQRVRDQVFYEEVRRY